MELQKSRVGEMAIDSELQVKGRDLTQPQTSFESPPGNHCQFISSVE